MDPATWAKVKDVLATALELPEEERDAFLVRECQDPEALRAAREIVAANSPEFLKTVRVLDSWFTSPNEQPADDDLSPGTMVGHYTILERLGIGGMGRVYLANDSKLKRRVALKFLLSSSSVAGEDRRKILAEARNAARISHLNVATVYEVEEVGERALIVMEYVDGRSLLNILAEGRLSVGRALGVARQLAAALGAAHAEGIVHRDLKPGNVQVRRDGVVKVLDFGIAQALSSASPDSTTTTTISPRLDRPIVGTPAYMSPEQLLGGDVDYRSDIYSLGVVLFEMVKGHRPYRARDAVELAQAIELPIPRADAGDKEVPSPLADVIARMLEKDSTRRYQSAAAADEALATVESGIERREARNRWLRGAGAAAAIVLLLMLSLLLGTRTHPSSSPDRAARAVIGVVPLENFTDDPGKQYLGPGFAETVALALGRIPQLSVISGADVQAAMHGNREPRKIASALGATFLVDGTVQQIADRFRVTLKLLAPDGHIEWAEGYEASLSEVFTLQQRMAAAIVRELARRVRSRAPADPTIPSTTNPEALTSYWQGRSQLESAVSREQIEAAIATFQRVVQLDPTYSLGYAGLAGAFWRQYTELHTDGASQQALGAGLTALHLDPDQPAVRVAVATIYEGMGQNNEAEEELTKALVVQPNDADAHRVLARVRGSQARWNEAISEYQQAIELRPASVQNYIELGRLLTRLQRLREAVDVYEKAIRVDPTDSRLYVNIGAVYAAIPDNEKALEFFKRANAIQPTRRGFSNVATISYRLGRFEEAVAAYQEALKFDPKSEMTHASLGDTYMRLNRRSEAREEYGKARELSLDALRVNERDAEKLSRTAVFEAKLGMRDQAISRIARAQALARDDVEIQYRRAVVEAQIGHRDQALAELSRAIELGYSKKNAAEDDDLMALRSSETFRALVGLR